MICTHRNKFSLTILLVAPVGCFRDKGQRAFPKVHRMPRDTDYNTFPDRVRECRDKVDSEGEDYEVYLQLSRVGLHYSNYSKLKSFFRTCLNKRITSLTLGS